MLFHVIALSFETEKLKANVKKVMSMGFHSSSATIFMKTLYVISHQNGNKRWIGIGVEMKMMSCWHTDRVPFLWP